MVTSFFPFPFACCPLYCNARGRTVRRRPGCATSTATCSTPRTPEHFWVGLKKSWLVGAKNILPEPCWGLIRQDWRSSTGSTDVVAAVHPTAHEVKTESSRLHRLKASDEPTVVAAVHMMVMCLLTERFSAQISSAPNEPTTKRGERRCKRRRIYVSMMQWLADVEGHRMNQRWWKMDHRFIRRYEFLKLLPNDSLDVLGYLYPTTHPFEIAGLCGSAEECKTLRRSYPRNLSAKLLIHTRTCVVCV
jgi:hypothetical protein